MYSRALRRCGATYIQGPLTASPVDRWDGRTILVNRQIYRYRGPLILAAQVLAAHAELVALDRARILVDEERERLEAQADLDAALGLIDRGDLSAEDLAAVQLLLRE